MADQHDAVAGRDAEDGDEADQRPERQHAAANDRTPTTPPTSANGRVANTSAASRTDRSRRRAADKIPTSARARANSRRPATRCEPRPRRGTPRWYRGRKPIAAERVARPRAPPCQGRRRGDVAESRRAPRRGLALDRVRASARSSTSATSPRRHCGAGRRVDRQVAQGGHVVARLAAIAPHDDVEALLPVVHLADLRPRSSVVVARRTWPGVRPKLRGASRPQRAPRSAAPATCGSTFRSATPARRPSPCRPSFACRAASQVRAEQPHDDAPLAPVRTSLLRSFRYVCTSRNMPG